MVSKFITKGRGAGRKVIPIRSGSTVHSIKIPRQFYGIPVYIQDIAQDEIKRNYMRSVHSDMQLLNHLRSSRQHIIGNIGHDNLKEWIKLKISIDGYTFDSSGYLRSKGVPQYKIFLMDTDAVLKAVLKYEGAKESDVDDFLYLYGRHYKFTGIDGHSYDIRFRDIRRGYLLTPDVEHTFTRYLNMDHLFNYYRDDMFTEYISKNRMRSLKAKMFSEYHKVYKGKKGYLKV